MAQTVTVSAVDDAVAEGTHTATIPHSGTSSDPNYNGMTVSSVTVPHRRQRQRRRGQITESRRLDVTEGGATRQLQGGAGLAAHGQRDRDPGQRRAGHRQPDASSSSRRPTGTWPKTVTVTAVDDAVAEGTHTGTIPHRVASSDPNYSGLTVGSVTCHITDNDSAGVFGDPVGRIARPRPKAAPRTPSRGAARPSRQRT